MSSLGLLKRRIALTLILLHALGAGGSSRGAVLCVEDDGHASIEYACGAISCENAARWHSPIDLSPAEQPEGERMGQTVSCVDVPLGDAATQHQSGSVTRARALVNVCFADVPYAMPLLGAGQSAQPVWNTPVLGAPSATLSAIPLRI